MSDTGPVDVLLALSSLMPPALVPSKGDMEADWASAFASFVEDKPTLPEPTLAQFELTAAAIQHPAAQSHSETRPEVPLDANRRVQAPPGQRLDAARMTRIPIPASSPEPAPESGQTPAVIQARTEGGTTLPAATAEAPRTPGRISTVEAALEARLPIPATAVPPTRPTRPLPESATSPVLSASVPSSEGEAPVASIRSADPVLLQTRAADIPQSQAPTAPAPTPTATPVEPPRPMESATIPSLAITSHTEPSTRTAPPLEPFAMPSNPPPPVVQVADRVLWMMRNDQRTAQLRLWPRELGVIDIHLSLDADTEAVRIAMEASSAAVREDLQHAVPRLRQMLAEQGLSLSQFDVQQHARQRSHFSRPADSDRHDQPATAAGDQDSLPRDAIWQAPARLIDLFA